LFFFFLHSYGSRHLAQVWADERVGPRNRTSLDYISGLVVLDLLGLPFPNFYPMHAATADLFVRLTAIEDALRRDGLLRTKFPMFHTRAVGEVTAIDDDHAPFEKRGVPCLHIIPIPFPAAWHTDDDTPRLLHEATYSDLATIFRQFAAEALFK